MAALNGLIDGTNAIQRHPGAQKGQDDSQPKPGEKEDQDTENDRGHAAQHENPPTARRLTDNLHAKAAGQQHGFGWWRRRIS